MCVCVRARARLSSSLMTNNKIDQFTSPSKEHKTQSNARFFLFFVPERGESQDKRLMPETAQDRE